jgi:SAM-dependent methyltransferase
MTRTTAAFRCTKCHSEKLSSVGEGLKCESCAAEYPFVNGTIDFLDAPDSAVSVELTGLATENNIDVSGGLDAVKWLATEKIETTEDLMDSSRDERTRYYQQTAAAFLEGLSRIKPDSGMRVLEIGAERTFFNLRVIRDLCSEAFALNIFFHVTEDSMKQEWPTRVLGDMNQLPFADGYFDLVICSATLHHTPTIDRTLQEVARVLRAGGRALIVNEPVEGSLKARGLRRGLAAHGRDEQIHEEPVTMRQWQRAIRASGLRPDSFVPAWFMQQVAEAEKAPADQRFASVARTLSPVLKSATLQDVARIAGRLPAQFVLGLPLNVVLWKSDASA